MRHIPLNEIPRHKTKSVRMLAVASRIQAIMINENLTPDEIVACAEAVRSSCQCINAEPRTRVESANIPVKGINDES